MNPDCNILNPLQRTGLSQRKRLIRALHPSYVLVDERDTADLLLYAKEYAAQLNYYSLENTVTGDWRRFIESDISTLVAMIAKFDVSAVQKTFEAEEDVINSFEPIIELLRQVYEWKRAAIEGLSLYAALDRSINATIRAVTETVISYQKRISTINGGFTFEEAQFSFADVTPANIDPDNLLYLSGDYANEEDTDFAKRKIKQLFKRVYETVVSLVQQAPKFLEETFTNYPQHEPHIALFLTFLQLYKIAQNHLNEFTKRHLDFYYQEVLQVTKRPEQADEVHLIFQLAKNFDDYLIKKDTAFKAGKDENGVNVTFATDNQIVINKIQRYEDGLKSIFIEKKENGVVKNIYAAPVANSVDGKREAFTENEKWLTFGDATMPDAEVGFAIASPIFFLQEGERIVTLTFHFNIVDNSPINFVGNTNMLAAMEANIQASFSVEKEWVICENLVVTFNAEADKTSDLVIDYKITIGAGLPAFVAYKEQELKAKLATTLPVLRFLFNKNEPDQPFPYQYFQFLTLERLDLKVAVTGMKNLILENDQGILNPAKPFLPFGAIPKVGSKFYIGSPEVFQKSLTSLNLTLNWIDVPNESFSVHYNGYTDTSRKPSNDQDFVVDVKILTANGWKVVDSDKAIFDTNPNGSPPKYASLFELDNTKLKNYSSRKINVESFEQFNLDLSQGFIKLDLKKDFLHSNYSSSLTAYINNEIQGQNASERISMLAGEIDELAGKINEPTEISSSIDSKAREIKSLVDVSSPPNEPYTPTLSEFKLSYTSTETIHFAEQTFENSPEQFFHLHPFGGTAAFYPNDANLPAEKVVYSQKLVPEFTENANTSTPANGTLYIGLTDVEPPQNVSILFQVAEGSANPDKTTPVVAWAYLANNRWYDFEQTQIVSDTTAGLLNSGIITFALPKQINANNTILPKDAFWIKASVESDTDAISQMIAVLPQAVKASFRKTAENDLSRLATPLTNETISKLVARQAAVKKVLQPFASFNGRLEEQNETPSGLANSEERFSPKYNEYYIRVSERLKHKNRAITIDDYERIILQQFPDIYSAKCLNHARVKRENRPASEHAPGAVKIIVLPNLRNQNAIDPLRPRVSSARLEAIEQFLKPLMSDFVELEVRNPFFEEVVVDFKVKLNAGFDQGFYLQKLQEDIVRFLSPWLYDEDSELEIGGKIHRSVILNFVEEQEYVDYLTDFKLHHFIPKDNGDYDQRKDVEEAIVTTSSSVLIPRIAEKQMITFVNPKTT